VEAKKVIEFKSARAKTLSADRESLQQHVQVLCSQVQELQEEFRKGKKKLGELWQPNCQQLTVHDNLMFEKEEEIRLLRMRLQEVEMELTKLKVEGIGMKTQPIVSFASSTTSTESSILHDPQEVMTDHEEFPRLASVTSTVPFLHSQVVQGMMQSPLTPLTSSQQHTDAY